MTQMKYIRVVPGVEIGLLEKPCAGDKERFCRLFGETWRQIPSEDREALTDYWCSYPDTSRPCYTELETGLLVCLNRGELPAGHGAAAVAYENSHEIAFLGPYMDSVPDHIVKAIIAHELAHIRLRIDNPTHLGRSVEERKAAEQDANGLGDDWGFECTSASHWHQAHIDLWQNCVTK